MVRKERGRQHGACTVHAPPSQQLQLHAAYPPWLRLGRSPPDTSARAGGGVEDGVVSNDPLPQNPPDGDGDE